MLVWRFTHAVSLALMQRVKAQESRQEVEKNLQKMSKEAVRKSSTALVLLFLSAENQQRLTH